ncbi:ROK family protein [Phenylobacterium aquaticum]|uniref:ROK family protein n=1 Tax=Phenylobacterium aquaticum TaxID=1763816 RepID=UPI001F5C3F04|nr:ROK family protein [Phenylobacterium aquaticum]MCI3131439.1 ROK family protein [Phenylobacterium aquaticum]
MIRIGVDFGGTKIEAAALDADGRFLARLRAPNPRDYDAALRTVANLVADAEQEAGGRAAAVGVGMPGSISPANGLIRNANSTWLNGRSFGADLEQVLGRPVRLANDANCMALSEATDGAGADSAVVFAVIIGTGCGGGLVVDRQLVNGRNGVAGEWGHTPLPWPSDLEHPGPTCWCGRRGCLETWISGTGLERDHGGGLAAHETVAQARSGDADASAALDRYVDRLARGLAVVCDIVDPDVIVLAGGMSNVDELYSRLPSAIAPHVFTDAFTTPVRKAVHGDSSGVRGAAWLWPLEGSA